MNVILLIDATCICYIAKHSMKGLSWEDIETGVIFGFMQHIKRLAVKFDTNKFIFAWDSRKSRRRDQYPPYKQVRWEKEKPPKERQLDEIAHTQLYTIRNWILSKLGFYNNFIQTGLEADDIIARVVLDNQDKKLIIVTTDKDFYQCLSEHCIMYSPRSKELYTAEDFKKEWGIPPSQWANVLSLAGCNTDEVKGISRVGKVVAVQYLRRELKGKWKVCQAIESKEGKAIVDRNLELVKLPHASTLPVRLKRFDAPKIAGFLDVFHRFGFQSFLKHDEFQRWRKAMRM